MSSSSLVEDHALATSRSYAEEYVATARRAWPRLALALVVGGSLGAIIALIIPPAHQFSAFVTTARIDGQPIVAPEAFLEEVNGLGYAARLQDHLDGQHTAWSLRGQFWVRANGDVYAITASNPDLTEGRVILGAIEQTILQDLNDRYVRAIRPYREFEQVLLQQIETAEADLDDVRQSLARLRAQPRLDIAATLFLQGQLEERQRALTDLHRDLRDVRLILGSRSQEARVAAPSIHRPSSPGTRIVVFAAAGALVLGLAFTIAVAIATYLRLQNGTRNAPDSAVQTR